MTNTLHRRGTSESLKNDYVIFAHTAKGITREGSAPKLQEFMRICLKYHPVNIGDGKQGNIHQDDIDIQRLISNQGDSAGAAAVFTDLDTLQKVTGPNVPGPVRSYLVITLWSVLCQGIGHAVSLPCIHG